MIRLEVGHNGNRMCVPVPWDLGSMKLVHKGTGTHGSHTQPHCRMLSVVVCVPNTCFIIVVIFMFVSCFCDIVQHHELIFFSTSYSTIEELLLC